MTVAEPVQPLRVFVSVTVTFEVDVAPTAGLVHLIVSAFVPEPLTIEPFEKLHEYVLPTTFGVLYVAICSPHTFVGPVMAGAGGFVIVTFCDTVVVHCDGACHLARVIVPVPTVFHLT